MTTAVGADLRGVLSGVAGPAGVRRLLTGPAERQRLARCVQQALTDERPVDVRVRRAKLRPGRKLTGYFDVVVAGSTSHPVAVTWQSGVADALEVRNAGGHLVRRGVAGPFARLAAFDAELGALVQVSPLDDQFPYLAAYHDQAHLRRVLGRTLSPPAAGYVVRPVRYRPGRRHLLRVEGAAGPKRAVIIKFAAGNHHGHAAAVARAVSDVLERAGAGTALRPLLSRSKEGVVVTPHVRGAALSWWLRHRPDRALPMLVRTGRLVRALHDSVPPGAVQPSPSDISADIAEINRAGQHIAALVPQAAARMWAVLEIARQAMPVQPVEAPVLVHGNLKADHVVVDDDRLVVLDLERCAVADPAADLSRFFADLAWWELAAGPRGVRAAAARRRAFLTGYGACAPERLSRAKVLEPLALLKIAASRPRLFDPNWASLTNALVARAEQVALTLEAA